MKLYELTLIGSKFLEKELMVSERPGYYVEENKGTNIFYKDLIGKVMEEYEQFKTFTIYENSVNDCKRNLIKASIQKEKHSINFYEGKIKHSENLIEKLVDLGKEIENGND